MIDSTSEFSRRLNLLFEFRTKSDGSAYTEGELIAATGGALSLRQLRRLRSGQSTNPSLRAVKAIADFFQVDVAYFTALPAELPAELEPLVADDLAQKIATQSAKLDDKSKQAILKLIDSILVLRTPDTVDSDQAPENTTDQEVSHDGK
jgi:transcriptional regulator with XRE-family HTH domain